MDKLFVENLQVEAIIGVHPRERVTLQPLLISFTLLADTSNAAASDDITDAMDYEDLAGRVTDLARASRYRLIEALAEEVAAFLLQHCPASRAVVEVRKPDALPDAECVGIRIERGP